MAVQLPARKARRTPSTKIPGRGTPSRPHSQGRCDAVINTLMDGMCTIFEIPRDSWVMHEQLYFISNSLIHSKFSPFVNPSAAATASDRKGAGDTRPHEMAQRNRPIMVRERIARIKTGEARQDCSAESVVLEIHARWKSRLRERLHVGVCSHGP